MGQEKRWGKGKEVDGIYLWEGVKTNDFLGKGYIFELDQLQSVAFMGGWCSWASVVSAAESSDISSRAGLTALTPCAALQSRF